MYIKLHREKLDNSVTSNPLRGWILFFQSLNVHTVIENNVSSLTPSIRWWSAIMLPLCFCPPLGREG